MLIARLLVAALGATGLCCSAATYQLEYVSKAYSAFYAGLNRHGAVSGQTDIGNLTFQAHVYENGSIRLLQAVGDGNTGKAINDRGDVAGECQQNDRVKACLWRADGSVRAFRGPDGHKDYITVADVNNAQQVVGYAQSRQGPMRAYLFDNGVSKDLGAFDGVTSRATGINKAGHVSGYSTNANGVFHAFIHDGTQLKDLGTLADHSFAEDLNDDGVAVGRADVSNGERHAVMFKGGQIIDLNPLGGESQAMAINNHEVVVGQWGPVGSSAAFVYKHGRMINLNHQLDPVTGEGWRLVSAVNINDRGQIAAIAKREPYDFHVVLLTPMD
ncbi:MAG TPA: hypothetical protein VFY73_03725 [Ideonella sp.]|uniref:hypothetical protein n=1 Tax=Ideonella sp. TaxID=1929293 RepID=UPI002E32D090|nr:hypothetical protein [Ideonella sp.]HEX5683124.1 hypothetical protein [Ideonella sp.]